MLHFPSKLQTHGSNGIPKRSDSLGLNATQQKSASHPIFLKVEEELHDARRVHSDGQEDDLRSALSMVINRVTELSSMLGEAYKTQADLEVQLNVAKSNLKLVIANNEMLEDALKRDTTGQSKDVGWRRSSARDGEGKDPRASIERSQSVDYPPASQEQSPPPSAGTPPSSTANHTQDNRFFKFRFSTSSATPTRPGTPTSGLSHSASGAVAHHLTSPSMPSLATVKSKELEELMAELEKEKAALEKEKVARKAAMDEKAALEDELESLSQALFEEANNMVATERKMRAETEEELKELKQEKEALRSALRLIEGENTHLRSTSVVSSPQPEHTLPQNSIPSFSPTHSRSSSRVGIKSRPHSLDLASTLPLPPSPSPHRASLHLETPSEDALTKEESLSSPNVLSPDEESQPTPRFRTSMQGPSTAHDIFTEASPWADVPSNSISVSKEPTSMLYTAAFSR